MTSVCRFCGVVKNNNDFVTDINEIMDMDKQLTLSNYISIYCRVELDNNPLLPLKVCRLCRIQVEVFMAFSENLNQLENSLKTQV